MQIILYILFVFLIISCQSPDDWIELLDPNVPGIQPEKFAEGIISNDETVEFSICFAPDGKEIFFSRRTINTLNQIMVMRLSNGIWSQPEPFEYSQDCFEFEPYISPDGKKLFYGSKRPLPGSDTLNWFPDIWICYKGKTGWTEPIHYNTGMMYISMTNDNKIYFTGFPDTWDGQFIAFQDSFNSEFRKLPNSINYLPYAGHPFISPDENFLIYDSQIDTDMKDLYISYKDKDGNWIKSIKMGEEINTEVSELCAMLSPDKSYLFFSRAGDIYWVSTDILENYLPKHIELN